MKIKIRLFIVGLGICVFTGCSQNGVESTLEQETRLITEDIQEDVWEESSELLTEKGEIQPDRDIKSVNFNGLGMREETPDFGNLPMNLKQMRVNGLVCPAGDKTYYVNCGGDNYLYELTDNGGELVLKQVVSSLNLWDGALFFVLHEDRDIRGMGKICRYDLKSQTMETVLDVDALYCCVNQDGIYYARGEVIDFGGGVTGLMQTLVLYSSADGSEKEYYGGRWDQYGNYFAQPIIEQDSLIGLGIYNLDSEEIGLLYEESDEDYLTDLCIIENYYCGINRERDTFVWIDLLDGSITSIEIPADYEMRQIYDYIYWNDKMYLSLGTGGESQHKLVALDMEAGKLHIVNVIEEGNEDYWNDALRQDEYVAKPDYSYQEMFSDGNHIYVLKHFQGEDRTTLEDDLVLVRLDKTVEGFREVELANEK